MDKRQFLKTSSLIGIGSLLSLPGMSKLIESVSNITPDVLAKDEDFWEALRKNYKLNPEYINLENGYYCIQPEEILEAYIKHIRDVNYQGAYYMRTVQFENKNKMVAKLSELAGCEKDELIITRNTTESLDMIIAGMNWKEGDEAIMAEQDYGAMLDMFSQVSNRYGVINKIISIPNHPKSDE